MSKIHSPESAGFCTREIRRRKSLIHCDRIPDMMKERESMEHWTTTRGEVTLRYLSQGYDAKAGIVAGAVHVQSESRRVVISISRGMQMDTATTSTKKPCNAASTKNGHCAAENMHALREACDDKETNKKGPVFTEPFLYF